MYKPYEDQQLEIDKMISFLKSKSSKKEVYVYPTGYGKSVLIANVASSFPEKWFINIVPKKELLEQNYTKYTSYGYEAGICSASLGKNELHKVLFATIGTLKKHADFFSDKDVVIVHDECHSNSLKDSQLDVFIQQIKKCKIIGLTATPLRLDNGWLKMMNRMRDCFYTSIGSVVQIQEVVRKDRWTKILYEVERLDQTMLNLNSTGNDYTEKSLRIFYEKNDIVSKSIASIENLIDEGRKSIIVYLGSVKDAETLSEKVNGFKVLHGKTSKKERTDIINGFKSGKILGISNVGVLIEGLDHPALDAIVMARPTNSLIIWYQSVGRLVRKHQDKKDGKVIDLSGCYDKFGPVESITFENNPYTNGFQAWSGDKMLTGYSLKDGYVPSRQQEISRYEANMRRKLRLSGGDVFSEYKITFGKYAGKTVRELMLENLSYLKWSVSKSGWDFNVSVASKYREEVVKEVGIMALFDMRILVIADPEFKDDIFLKQKVNNYLSSDKCFMIFNGMDDVPNQKIKDYMRYNDKFYTQVYNDNLSGSVDGVIAFHNGNCPTVKRKVDDFVTLGKKVRIVKYE